MTATGDPIALELFKNAIFSIADEMALTITRTTYSGVLKENMDFSTAFADARGKLVAQALTLPAHLGSMPTALDSIMHHFEGDMAPGDVFALNDPFDGGMHLPDVFVFEPIYAEGRRLGFAATVCHQTDMGGRVAGSNASDSTEIYQEGLRIPPLRMYDKGERNETLFALIEKNVRVPVRVLADLRAQLAACHTGKVRFLELVERRGADAVEANMQELVDYAERLTRAALRRLPDGEFSFEDWIDDDGIDRDTPIRIHVTFTKTGDRLKADWGGCSAQVKGAINNTLSFTKAATYCAVMCVLPANIPPNEGVFRAIDVTAPAGSIANGVLPAACAARALTGFRMVDCAFGALSNMVPDKVFAAGDGGATGVAIGGYHADRSPFVYVDFTSGTWGGLPWGDGAEGNSNVFSNLASQSIEVTETEHPVEILAYDFVTDKAGAGLFRGGTPYRRDYRLTADEAVLQVRADRRRFPPYGLFGGQPGKPSANFLNPDTENRPLPSKVTMTLHRGDVFRHELAGAGGWGDPLLRDPDAVLKDVRDELTSPETARRDYGVVVDAAGRTVDYAATEALRSGMRSARNGVGMP